MKKKIKKIQIFRFAVQIIFFILLPGLFTLTFSELKNIYEMVTKGNFNFLSSYQSLIEVIVIIPLTIVLGRFFCGWMCAFGTFNDVLHMISKNIFKINIKVDEKVDNALKYLKYVVLAAIIVISWIMGSTILKATSPWDAFAQLTSFPNITVPLTIGLLVLLLITVGAFFIERFFCRYLCPLGAIFSIVSKVSIFKINKPKKDCGKCRLCTNNCSMGLDLYKKNNVHGGDCINCFKCVETCPRKNVTPEMANEELNPAFASSVALASFVAFYGGSNVLASALGTSNVNSTAIVSTANNNNTAPSTNSSQNSNSGQNASSSSSANNSNATSTQNGNSAASSTATASQYKDGTYTGTADGFRPGLTVQVTIKGGKITDIQITQINDTPGFYQNAINTVPQEIISAQSTNVDTVSGATYSSTGIINAVQAALDSAKA